jgi:uncharacterized protein (TIGR02466 family)
MIKQENNPEFKKYTPLISTGIYEFQLENLDISNLIKICYEIKDKDQKGIKRTNIGGWQSNSNIFLSYSPLFFIVSKLNELLKNSFKNPNIHIKDLWINISSYGHYNTLHTHVVNEEDNIKKSGVLYLQVPPKSGEIRFINPLQVSHQIFFLPTPGQLLVFDKILPHSVSTNLSQEDRISIAFNCNI